MLATRVLSGACLILAVTLVLCVDEWFAPFYPLWFLFAATSMALAAYELVGLLDAAGIRPSTNSVMGGVSAIMVANWLPHVTDHFTSTDQLSGLSYEPHDPVNVLAWPFLAFVGVLMLCFVVQSIQFVRPGKTMATIASTILVVAYVGLLGTFLIQMRWLEGRLHGIIPLLYVIACAKGADTGAYTLGRIAGRHKLWPSLSPNKTVEGAIGGLAFSVAAALLVKAFTRSIPGVPTLDWIPALEFGLVIGVVAQLGDLMESMIKRDCERKDASTAVPGFGGVLDVLDSLLFAGPVAFMLWLLVGT